MNYIISVFTYFMDMLTLSMYLKSILNTPKDGKRKYFFFTLFITELLLFVNECIIANCNIPYSILITSALSLMTTFVMSLFFYVSVKARILTAITFQVLVSLGETLFSFIVSCINKDFFKTDNIALLYAVMNCGSKIVLFIFSLIISALWTRKKNEYPAEYTILLFVTPTVSLVIFFLIPLKSISVSNNNFIYEVLFVSLLILNIVNYILINRTYEYVVVKIRSEQIEQQINFQKEKYDQLSESYRQSRRILHDTKKHYFSIREYASNHETERILSYLSEAICDLESTYVKYNTGNLVIDSLITNYENLSKKNHICFFAKLNVDNKRIPISDYDLCIILGNILDNAINACLDAEGMKVQIEIETTENDKFVIHSENTIFIGSKQSKTDNLDHGFGLYNIKKTVQENNGFMTYQSDRTFVIDIMLPIIEKKQRLQKQPETFLS